MSPQILGLADGGNIVTDLAAVSNLLVNFFAGVSKSCAYNEDFLRHKAEIEAIPVDFATNELSTLNTPFSMNELNSALFLKKSSAPGPDEIQYEMLRRLPMKAKELLLSLYNYIFETRTFPESWKRSHVISLHKPGKDKLSPSSYRPICLTSCVCKVFEKMINRRLIWYLEKNHLLTPEQCGFREERSTLDHLVSIETTILDAFVERKQVVAVFFDLEKAYDTAWPRGIVNTLSSWGVGGNMLAFIDNFMKGRSIQVRLGNTLSDPALIENGVPQGSVLSCTLFAVAINDITECIYYPAKCSLFVDDFAIYVATRRLHTAESVLQHSIGNLEAWSKRTGFTFSSTKTKCVKFSKLRDVAEPNLTLNGLPITVQESAKFLGLTLDARLTWVPHLKNLKSRCLKRLNIMKSLSGSKWGSDRTSMLRLYHAYIRSCLDYGSQVYSSARPYALKMLNTIHNTAIRLATGAFRSSPVPSLLAESSEMSLEDRRKLLMGSYFCSLKSRPYVPAYESVFRNTRTNMYSTRPRANRPFGIRTSAWFREVGMTNLPVMKSCQIPVPPWTVPSIVTDLSLTNFVKSQTSDTQYSQILHEKLDALKPCDVLYTDGSRSELGTGCAFIAAGQEYKYRLHSYSSVYSAELTAILSALLLFRPSSQRVVICSDSLSSIQAIMSMYPKHCLVRNIHAALYDISQRQIEVMFLWIPGHVGLAGNEAADKAAKSALNLPLEQPLVIALDLKTHVKNKIKENWITVWQDTEGNKLRALKNDVALWETSNRVNRREEVVLCRLRIGHTLLTHGYLMAREDPPLCRVCNISLSIRHLLEDCPEFCRERRICQLPSRLENILTDDECVVKRLFSFLKRTGLIDKI